LSEKLGRLETAISVQEAEMKGLQSALARPDMQKAFIELAERFLQAFENKLDEDLQGPSAIKSNMMAKDAVATVSSAAAADDSSLAEAKAADVIISDSDQEKRKQELRQQIASCQDKINTLLKTIKRKEEQGQIPRSDDERENSEEPKMKSLVIPTNLKYGYLLGKRAGANLYGRNGELLISKGQTIALAQAEDTYNRGLLDELVRYIEC